MKPDLEDELADNSLTKEELLEQVPEEQRWDPIGGSEGRRIEPVFDTEEDDDGRQQGAMLVESGVQAAEFDQMLQADRAESEKDELSDQRIEKITDADIGVLEGDKDELSDQGIYELDQDDEGLATDENVELSPDNANNA